MLTRQHVSKRHGKSAPSVEVLRRVPYFAARPATELSRLAGRCAVRGLGPGETLFEEGEPCRGLLIVAEGRVEIRKISLRGREQVFHTEGPGATLGEGPLFDGGGYIASAVALAPTRVLLLWRAEVLHLCQRRPVVALAMLKTLARRVRHFADIVSDLAFRPVTERVARHLDTAVARPNQAGHPYRAHPDTGSARRAPRHRPRARRARLRPARGERGDRSRPIARHDP